MKNFKLTFYCNRFNFKYSSNWSKKFLGTWKELTQEPDSKYYFEINIDEIDSEEI